LQPEGRIEAQDDPVNYWDYEPIRKNYY